MVRPSSLFRSNSHRQQPIEANANNIQQGSIDCGITALNCCNTAGCQKLGNKKTFTVVLALAALFQGAVESYFRVSAKQAALNHDYDPQLVDWLLVASGVFQGLIAILVGYWGNRLHRTAWLGGCTMLQSVLCLFVIIPTLVHNNEDNNTIDAIETSILCIRSTSGNLLSDSAHGITTLILLFVLQFGIALGLTSLYTLGLSFLDDNSAEHESPGLIAVALAAKFLGFQLGALVTLFVRWTSFGWWFGWVFIAPLLFTVGLIAALYPRRLLATVVQHAANSILESSTNQSHASLARIKFIADPSFFSTIMRLITNKILILNILAAMFVQTAFINFSRHESNYLQSRFFLPTDEVDGLIGEWTSTLIAGLLKPPMVALAILVAGLVIAKVNPSSRKLVIWNIVALSLLVAFYLASIFITCETSSIAGSTRNKILKPYCAHSCFCSEHIPFMPVCPEDGVQTYFSPCHAGCGAEIYINNVRMFGNCSCGVDTQLPMMDLIATEGACGMDDCQPYWIVYQALSVFASALLGSTLIGKLIITIRAVMPQDKASALAIELSLVSLIVYIPGKFAYRAIADHTCQYTAPDQYRCYLHENPTYGNLLNVTTTGLILIALLFEALLLMVIGNLKLYGEPDGEVLHTVEMEPLRRFESPQPGGPRVPDRQRAVIDEISTAQTLAQSSPIRVTPPNTVTYAQIIRPTPQYQNVTIPPTQADNLDFRLQTPSPSMHPQPGHLRVINNESANGSGRSSISSGYIDLTPNQGRMATGAIPKHHDSRPKSPETSF